MSTPYNPTDTLAALATPPGVGGLHVVRVSGPQAYKVVNALWQGKTLDAAAAGTHRFGHLVRGGAVLDQAVAALFAAPNSYTGDDVVELSIHGSPFVAQQVLQALYENGARPAGPGEFTLRAFLNGKMDLSQAEAVADLIDARTEGAHALALGQLRGGFRKAIEGLRERLLHHLALVELELDFSEEDVQFADRTELVTRLNTTLVEVQRLLAGFATGQVLRHGLPTVIAGRPNAGKSTLLNALVGDERALVSAIPGTTRDIVEDRLVLAGMELRLMDTAGLRATTDAVEAMGVERTRRALSTAALCLWVFNGTIEAPETVLADVAHEALPPGTALLLVANHLDTAPLHEAWKTYETQVALLGAPRLIQLSAHTGQGIENLLSALGNIAKQHHAPDHTLTGNARHHAALAQAATALEGALDAFEQGIPTDLAAQWLREATNALGAIVGQVTSGDVLKEIFGRFCIGK